MLEQRESVGVDCTQSRLSERLQQKPPSGVRVVTADQKQYGLTVNDLHYHKDVAWVRWEGAAKPRPAGWRMLCRVR